MKAWRQLIGRETREESIEGNTAASSAVTPPIPQSLPQPERQPISQPPSKKIFPSGIKLLHDSGKSVIDIIFVHGLTGDREETWKAENAFDSWPKTLLPSKVADARVLTFGYDAYVANWRGMVSENRIGNHAMNLLTAIATHREDNDTNTRPIIFVCHSLGGLVCEDALVIAQQRPEKHLRQVLNCTRGILFIGTPHHGSGLAHWAESLAKSIGLLKQTNPEILNVLRRESEVLERVQGGFHTMLRTRAQEGSLPIEMTCFYEELPLPGVGLVVPKDSAILPGNISIGIRSNHMEMTKFDDLNHPGFISVAGELRRWSKAIAAAQLPQTSNVNASTSLQGPPQDLNGALPPALTTGFYKGIDISSLPKEFADHIPKPTMGPKEKLLLKAAGKGDMKLIEKLVKEGVNISAINDSGESALSKAISRRQINVARFLLENGATTEYPGFLVEKPLFSAVSTGNVKLVQLLLDHDADIDECSSVGTVLSKAAKAGQEDIVALLLSRDADVNLFNHLVYAPLYGAVTQNNDRLVRELLKHGAETGIMQDRNFQVPLSVLKPESCRLLLKDWREGMYEEKVAVVRSASSDPEEKREALVEAFAQAQKLRQPDVHAILQELKDEFQIEPSKECVYRV